MEASQNKNDVTIQFLVAGLVITLPEFSIYLFRSKVIQHFHACAMVKNFFQFLGANMTPKSFIANIQTPKRHFFEKICVD
jgi:chromate transport protein ChrA